MDVAGELEGGGGRWMDVDGCEEGGGGRWKKSK